MTWDKIALGVKPVNRLASKILKSEEIGMDNSASRIEVLEHEKLLLQQQIVMLKREADYANDELLKACQLMARIIQEFNVKAQRA